MTDLRIHQVKRVVVPDGYRRDRAIRPAGLSPNSHERYDFDTFFYQATRVGADIVLVAPKLLNFKRLFRQSRFAVGGEDISRVRIHTFYRHAIIWLRGAAAGDTLDVTFPDGQSVTTPIIKTDRDFFGGLNVQMTVSKDNDLRWIREQLSFHAAQCGLEGVCFIDNGSTVYFLDDLADVLTSVGLKRAALVSAPYKWGGVNLKPANRELYLQTAVYNIARFQYLAGARAVVRLDCDEILLPQPKGKTVFDLANHARLG